MKLWKITSTGDYATKDNTLWGEGVEHTAPGGNDHSLCNERWLHAYYDPRLAVLFQSIHITMDDWVLWEAEGDAVVEQADKVGCTRLKTLKIVDAPKITKLQRQAIGIRASLLLKDVDNEYATWAGNWLNGTDRSYETAKEVLAKSNAIPCFSMFGRWDHLYLYGIDAVLEPEPTHSVSRLLGLLNDKTQIIKILDQVVPLGGNNE